MTQATYPTENSTHPCGSGALAAGASFLLPGLGQFMARRPIRGAVFFILWLGALVLGVMSIPCPEVAPLFLGMLLVALILMVWASIDAGLVAGKIAVVGADKPQKLGIVLLVLAVIWGIWALIDSAKPGMTASQLLGSLGGMYAIFIFVAGGVVAAVGAIGQRWSNIATRVIGGIVIAALAFWVLDKGAQHTAKYMLTNAISPVMVRGNSMFPTLTDREVVLVHTHVPIRRFDCVAYKVPGEKGDWTEVKRVIGMPGETVEFISEKLFINGEEMATPPMVNAVKSWSKTLRPVPGGPGNPIMLKDDEYYVLGDNLDASYDSRYSLAFPDSGGYNKPGDLGVRHQNGALPKDKIIGRVTWQILPATAWQKN